MSELRLFEYHLLEVNLYAVYNKFSAHLKHYLS